MYTKGDIALHAYEELRISGVTVDPTPEDMSLAVRRLDLLVDSWKKYNICTGYVDSAETYDVDPSQESGVDKREVFALALNLAKSLAPAFGKSVSIETMTQAKSAYDGLFDTPPAQREGTPYQPLGAGSRSRFWYGGSRLCRPDYQQHIKNVPEGCDTLQMKLGQTKIFTLDLSDQLSEGNTLDSYESSSDGGVSIDSISETDAVFTVELTAGQVIASSIKITLIMTPSGEVNPVTTYINVSES